MLVDHKNRRPGDNRLRNLRICTHLQNSWNKGPAAGRKYKGVSVVEGKTRGRGRRQWKEDDRWKAWITLSGRAHLIGTFISEEHAAYAYNLFAQRHFGEFACLNAVTLNGAEAEKVEFVIEKMDQKRVQRKEMAGRPRPPKPVIQWPTSAMELVALPEP